MTPLRQGSKGPRVREIQGLLNSKGARPRLGVDGDFGPLTDTAVRTFQTAKHLPVDGLVGPKTWSALHNRNSQPRATVAPRGHDPFDLADLAKFFRDLVTPTPAAPPPRPSRPATVAVATPPSRPAARPAPAATPAPAAARTTTVPPVVSARDFGNYHRLAFQNYSGQGYVIDSFRQFTGGAIQILGTRRIIQPGNALPAGIRNECASLVQYFGIPNTRSWRRGPRVCDMQPGTLPVGTVVATLRDGVYHSDYSGRSHVGIYLRHDAYANGSSSGGVTLMDQFNGHPIAERLKRYNVNGAAEGNKSKGGAWVDASGVSHTRRVSWTSDGEEYYVLLTV
jgi:Putative peptidoglycan binding domain